MRPGDWRSLFIRGQKEVNVERLPDISGTRVWSGKKNEVLNITNLDANVAEKTARQVFAKVPGVFVYDMGGTGNQINIATRGLDPHRRWSLTSAERCHYKLRYVRISGQSLQYAHGSRRANSVGAGNRLVAIRGAVGGMLNYITKSATPPDE